MGKGSKKWWQTLSNLVAPFDTMTAHIPGRLTMDKGIAVQMLADNMEHPTAETKARYFTTLGGTVGLHCGQDDSIDDLKKAIEYGYQAYDVLDTLDEWYLECTMLSSSIPLELLSCHKRPKHPRRGHCSFRQRHQLEQNDHFISATESSGSLQSWRHVT